MTEIDNERPAGTATMAPLSLGILGAAAFGAAAGVGHGAALMASGAWRAAALFVGGALLAMPPLYLLSMLTGSRSDFLAIARRLARAVGAVGAALLGLAAPALYLSATLTTRSGPAVLLFTCLLVGAAGVVAVVRQSQREEAGASTRAALIAWAVFALAIGARLLGVLHGRAS